MRVQPFDNLRENSIRLLLAYPKMFSLIDRDNFGTRDDRESFSCLGGL